MQQFINTISDSAMRSRSDYHLTLGGLIEALKKADDNLQISPKIMGVGAYRGYYSDIALLTEGGNCAYKTEMDYDNFPKDFNKWREENDVEIDFTGTPKELATKLEGLVGLYFDGYKGGYNEIALDKPLWLAKDYGDCSGIAIIGINNKLELLTKQVD